MSSSFFGAWLRGEPGALALLPDAFRHSAARAEAVAAAAKRRVAPQLIAALQRQSAGLAPSPSRERHLEQLSQGRAVAAVTGQQVGLFTGPLFTVYKAATAVAVARALSEQTGRPCVPVFWLQTEDHDLPEIDHTFVPGAAGPERISLALPDAAASRVPVEHRVLGESVTAALAALRAQLGAHPHAAEHLALLERAYTPQATLARAFAEVISALFADDGLLVLDPRDAAIAALGAPLHRWALQRAAPLAEALASRGAALAAAGFTEQVHVRPGAPLAFFSPDGVQGPRYRLDPAGQPETWALVGHPHRATVTSAELSGWLEREPLRFTTSALLRPLLQDSVLPTAAYVGGPGEIAYFAQLQPLYEARELPMPLIVPRARFRVLDDRVRALLDKLGLTPDDVERPRDELLKRAPVEGGRPAPEELERRILAAVRGELSQLGALLDQLDPGLRRSLERTDETITGAVSKLVAKYAKAVGQRDGVAVERLERLRGLLLPNEVPQERVYGLPYFGCRFGGAAFVGRVREACEPFSGALRELTP